MARKNPYVRDNTPAEEAEIRAQIKADPDTWEAPDGAPVLRRGRPPGATKEQVTVRIDKDLISALKKPEPKGWQTRLNAALKKGMDADLTKGSSRSGTDGYSVSGVGSGNLRSEKNKLQK